MTVYEANQLLKRVLRSNRWYFERRGPKIWFIEKLLNTYNRIFPITSPAGTLLNEIYDFHIRSAINFVRRRRRFEARKQYDVKRKIVSGETFDDPSS
jgi:hypothetical protein